jgi:hypothetical protein
MFTRVGSLAAIIAVLSLGTAYAGKLSERTSAAAANVSASVAGSGSIDASDSGISAGVATGAGGDSGVGSSVSDRANAATADTGSSGAEPSSPGGPTTMTIGIDAARSLTIEDFASLTDEQREQVRKFLSKRQLRRLAHGCRHAGLDAELRGTCAYLSDYLR